MKCIFFQKQVNFVFHIVTAEGYKVDPSLTKSITNFLSESPRDIAGVCRLLGLLGNFCRYI